LNPSYETIGEIETMKNRPSRSPIVVDTPSPSETGSDSVYSFDPQSTQRDPRKSAISVSVEGTFIDSSTVESVNWTDDGILAERCIAGEVSAWEELYHRCHDPLCASIRMQLGRSGADAQLVDEMAARVWYALVDRDGLQLAKYKPSRGSLMTFIRLIARKEVSHYFRAEQRRLKKELAGFARGNRQAFVQRGESISTMVGEFMTSLTPREREFCYEYLQISSDDRRVSRETTYSSANIWQLTRRIYKKFLNYIGPLP
jgi:DNA-directed RNA polymerase specialized sigma24 family protein